MWPTVTLFLLSTLLSLSSHKLIPFESMRAIAALSKTLWETISAPLHGLL
eukprot:m.130175 g.130175  ORF g.130175 m.130175 type:complete len:50 (+) comp14768_c0_seq2:1649-1798(+)